MFSSLAFVVVSLLCTKATSGAKVKISNANDLIEFSNNVNSGTSYEGTTVYLGSDIDFTDELSKQFEPIGNTT